MSDETICISSKLFYSFIIWESSPLENHTCHLISNNQKPLRVGLWAFAYDVCFCLYQHQRFSWNQRSSKRERLTRLWFELKVSSHTFIGGISLQFSWWRDFYILDNYILIMLKKKKLSFSLILCSQIKLKRYRKLHVCVIMQQTPLHKFPKS